MKCEEIKELETKYLERMKKESYRHRVEMRLNRYRAHYASRIHKFCREKLIEKPISSIWRMFVRCPKCKVELYKSIKSKEHTQFTYNTYSHYICKCGYEYVYTSTEKFGFM